jgi:hypothetical protein
VSCAAHPREREPGPERAGLDRSQARFRAAGPFELELTPGTKKRSPLGPKEEGKPRGLGRSSGAFATPQMPAGGETLPDHLRRWGNPTSECASIEERE